MLIISERRYLVSFVLKDGQPNLVIMSKSVAEWHAYTFDHQI